MKKLLLIGSKDFIEKFIDTYKTGDYHFNFDERRKCYDGSDNTYEDYDNDVIEFDGTLEQFYNHCSRVYTKKLRSLKRRGRPSKYGN